MLGQRKTGITVAQAVSLGELLFQFPGPPSKTPINPSRMWSVAFSRMAGWFTADEALAIASQEGSDTVLRFDADNFIILENVAR